MIIVERNQVLIRSSNLVDAAIPTWVPDNPYAKDVFVMQGDYIYRSKDSANSNIPLTTPLKWELVGIKNSIALWDEKYIHLVSQAPEKIELLLESSGSDVVILGGVEAVDVTVEQFKAGDVIKTTKVITSQWLGDTFRDYVFEPVKKKDRAVIHLLPTIRQSLRITINRAGGIARCAYIIVGKKIDIGQTLTGGQISLEDFSKKDRTDEGVIFLEKGRTVETGSYEVLIDRLRLDAVKTKIKKQEGRPTVFIPTCQDTTMIYGFVKDFSPALGNQTIRYNIEIEEI